MIFFVTSRTLQVCNRGIGRSLKKFNDYLYSMSNEYKHVMASIFTDCREAPVKSTTITTGLGCLFFLYLKNPSYNIFLSQLTAALCDLSSTGTAIRSPRCQQRLEDLSKLHRLQHLNYSSFVLFSILWNSDHNFDLKTYASTCKFVATGWKELISENRIVDIGIAGRWRLIDNTMIDYDINESEWAA